MRIGSLAGPLHTDLWTHAVTFTELCEIEAQKVDFCECMFMAKCHVIFMYQPPALSDSPPVSHAGCANPSVTELVHDEAALSVILIFQAGEESVREFCWRHLFTWPTLTQTKGNALQVVNTCQTREFF